MIFAASRFSTWSTSHWAAFLFGTTFLVITILAHRKNAESKLARTTLAFLVFANLTAAFHTSGSHFFSGKTQELDYLLPLHLCDLTAFIAAAALLTRKALLCELTYYLGLGGTLQGLLTPNLHYDFPHPTYMAFFQLHLFVVIAALLLPLGLHWRPRQPLLKTMTRTFFIIAGYMLVIYGINLLLDTNYAFVIHKPENPSLYDHLGPHPWYILSVLGLVIIALLILSFPFLFTRKKGTLPLADK